MIAHKRATHIITQSRKPGIAAPDCGASGALHFENAYAAVDSLAPLIATSTETIVMMMAP